MKNKDFDLCVKCYNLIIEGEKHDCKDKQHQEIINMLTFLIDCQDIITIDEDGEAKEITGRQRYVEWLVEKLHKS